MAVLTYKGGPYDGKTRTDTIGPSGRQIYAEGCRDAAQAAGFGPGLYRRDGDLMTWIELPGAWGKKEEKT